MKGKGVLERRCLTESLAVQQIFWGKQWLEWSTWRNMVAGGLAMAVAPWLWRHGRGGSDQRLFKGARAAQAGHARRVVVQPLRRAGGHRRWSFVCLVPPAGCANSRGATRQGQVEMQLGVLGHPVMQPLHTQALVGSALYPPDWRLGLLKPTVRSDGALRPPSAVRRCPHIRRS